MKSIYYQLTGISTDNKTMHNRFTFVVTLLGWKQPQTLRFSSEDQGTIISDVLASNGVTASVGFQDF